MQQKLDTEFIDMYNINEENFWAAIEHIGRYTYAAWFVNKRNYDNVLDVACSNGYGCAMLADSAKSVLGVDVNEDLIEEAKQKNRDKENIEFLCLDVDNNIISEKMKRNDFCVITCFETLEHINYPEKFLSQLKDILKRDGRILLSLPASDFEPLDENEKPKNPHHLHVFDDEKIMHMFKKAKLEVEIVLGQSMINNLMRGHNTYTSRNPKLRGKTTANFKITPESIKYYTNIFAYPLKDDLEHSYSKIYVLKHKKY